MKFEISSKTNEFERINQFYYIGFIIQAFIIVTSFFLLFNQFVLPFTVDSYKLKIIILISNTSAVILPKVIAKYSTGNSYFLSKFQYFIFIESLYILVNLINAVAFISFADLTYKFLPFIILLLMIANKPKQESF